MSISKAFQFLKGASSYELFRKLKFRLRYPRNFWSTGKFFRSIGDVDLQTTRKYVQRQKKFRLAFPVWKQGSSRLKSEEDVTFKLFN
jgi:REP element-mobilizing transposase RayT